MGSTHADGDGVYEGSLIVDACTMNVHALTGSDGWSGGVVGYADSTCAVTNNFGFTVN